MIDPNDLIILRDGGTGDMGDVTDNENRTARFRPQDYSGRFCVVWVRMHFSGSGTGTATCTMNVDSAAGDSYDVALFEWEAVGKGTDAVLRIGDTGDNQLAHYLFDAEDDVVFKWTNPDAGNITWGIEIALKKVDEHG